MQNETIKSFLVSLGFQTDEASFKKMNAGIGSATKSIMALGTAVTATAVVVGAGITAFASKLEGLYFSANRVSASVNNIKAFEKAAENLGASSGEALQSVESLARMMRNQPGSEGLLNNWGIKTRQMNGDLRDTVDITADLGDMMAQMPAYLANQHASQFGISERVMLAMRDGSFRKELDAQKARLKDSGFNQAAKDAHQFMREMRELQTHMEAFGLKVYEAVAKKLGGSLSTFGEWFKTNGPTIAERVSDILILFIRLAEIVAPALSWIVEKLVDLDKMTDGWSTKIMAAAVAFKLLGGAAIIGGIMGLAGAMGALAVPILALMAAGGIGAGIGSLINKVIPASAKDKIGQIVAQVMASFGSDEANNALAANGVAGYQKRDAGSSGAAGAANGRDLVGFFMGKGWSRDQASGLASNIQHESNGNHQAVGDGGKAYGIAQWHPDRQANFTKWSGKDIKQSSLQDQLEFMNYELTQGAERKAGALLKASRSASQAGEIVSRHYERPAATEAEARKRGATAVQIAQSTTIHVAGGNAVETGKRVAAEQSRVNSDMARNAQGVIS